MAANTGTLTVRIPGYPQPIQFGDWTHGDLYHTVQLQQGNAQELQAFIGAEGSPIPGGTRVLTKVDTNIPRSGDNGLSEGWEALIYSLQVQPIREWATTNANIRFDDVAGQRSRPVHVGGNDPFYLNGGVLFDFLRKTYIRFTVNQKVQAEAPAEKFPQGSGMSVFGTTTDLEVANNGQASPRDGRAFVLPIWLRPNIAFVCKLAPQAPLGDQITPTYVDWSGLTATNMGFDVRVTLAGLIKRPVT